MTAKNVHADHDDSNPYVTKMFAAVRFVGYIFPWLIIGIVSFGPASVPLVRKYIVTEIEFNAMKNRVNTLTKYVKRHCQDHRDDGDRGIDCSKL